LVHTYRPQNKKRKKEDDKDKRKAAVAMFLEVPVHLSSSEEKPFHQEEFQE
jgi:hypothetical protein